MEISKLIFCLLTVAYACNANKENLNSEADIVKHETIIIYDTIYSKLDFKKVKMDSIRLYKKKFKKENSNYYYNLYGEELSLLGENDEIFVNSLIYLNMGNRSSGVYFHLYQSLEQANENHIENIELLSQYFLLRCIELDSNGVYESSKNKLKYHSSKELKNKIIWSIE